MSNFLPISLLLLLCSTLLGTRAHAQATPVELIEHQAGNWQLLRAGESFFVQGAGGDGPVDQLAAAGANCIRTWGIGDETQALLDEAQTYRLCVVAGHWLGHTEHGFDYHDDAMLVEQRARVRRDVLRHRDHPALLLWGIGNEMEGFAGGDDPAVWAHVQALAAMIHELDPYHPTMTVTAEIGGDRVRAVNELCPDIDIMGVNSYGGLPSLPERYREAGGFKPLLITEFGPPGTWEIPMAACGAPPELTSTQKARAYHDAYAVGCLDAADLCLGGFAFTWGSKIEATSTWYGMFLPTGEKLAAVDAMTEIWSGQPPANLCPEIVSFSLTGPDIVQPGDTLRIQLQARDPERASLTARWSVTGELDPNAPPGASQPAPLELDDILRDTSINGATLIAPAGGLYRAYLVVDDGAGAAATASVPFRVEGPSGSVGIKLPLAVYEDGRPEPWAPSGWMGNYSALEMDAACNENPHNGDTCLRFTYHDPGQWVGVAWQNPSNDWGNQPGGFDLSGARTLVFWARGERGGEIVDFSLGILAGECEYCDTAFASRKGMKLKREWKRYTLKLKGKDLSRVKDALCLVFERQRASADHLSG